MFSVFITQFLMNVYNPLARPVSWSVHLPVNGTVYNVTDSDDTPVDNQVGVVVVFFLTGHYYYAFESLFNMFWTGST